MKIRKIFVVIISIIIVMNLFSGTIFVKAADYIMNATFDDLSDWTLTVPSGDTITTVDASIIGSTGKCAKFNRVGTSGTFNAIKTLTSEQTNEFVVSAKVYSVDGNSKLTLYADAADGSPVAQMYYNGPSKKFQFNSANTNKDFSPAVSVQANKFHTMTMKISFDPVTKIPSAKYFLDGVQCTCPTGSTVRNETKQSIARLRIDGGNAVTTLYVDDLRVFLPPTASGLSISGTPKVDNVLTASYSFLPNDDSTEGTSLFRWFMSDTPDGSFSVINGANDKTFTPGTAQSGKYLKYEVTPKDANGIDGKPIMSSASTQAVANAVSQKPLATNVKINGTAVAGQILEGSYEYSSVVSAAESGTTFRWLTADTASGVPTPIAGATASTYKISSAYKGKYIFFEVTPRDAGGETGLPVVSDGVNVDPGKPIEDTFDDDPPTLYGWTVPTATLGEVIIEQAPSGGTGNAMKINRTSAATGTFTFSKTITPLRGNVIIKARVYPKNVGAKMTFYADGGETNGAISQISFDVSNMKFHDGSANIDFTPPISYEGQKWYDLEMIINTNNGIGSTAKYFVNGVEAKLPIGKSGVRTSQVDVRRIRFDVGAVISTIYVDNIEVYTPKVPVLENVAISGTPDVNNTLTGDYSFKPGEGYAEGQSIYRWLGSDRVEGPYIPINGETTKTLVVNQALAGKYIKFEATPVDFKGIVGLLSTSAPVRVPATGVKVLNTFTPQILTANSTLNSSTSIINFDKTPIDAVVMVALFDNKNTLKIAKRKMVTVGADSISDVNFDVNLPANVNGYSVKVYVWNKSSTMVPYCDSFELK